LNNERIKLRNEINRIFRHQIILPISECLGDKGRLHQLYLANNNISHTSRSAVIRSADHVIYCFKEREDAFRFCHHFGGRKLNRIETDGQLWFHFYDR
jgi:hypothetical protein